ncbi:Ku protein [Streptomyces sp. NPDC006482]|uniref:non-homologous end joining protein Ku n=1 Tax=Streptomyces sp. NPDC006482 TaxID=3154306 RepID=UPI0033A74A08
MGAPIVVHPPSPTGGRRVTARGENLGLAYEDKTLIELLSRTGLPGAGRALDDPRWVEWRGGRARLAADCPVHRDRQSHDPLPSAPARHRGPIRNRRVNERTGHEVDSDDIVKGFDTGGEYVIVEPKELDDIAPGRSKALEVSEFLALDTVDPIFFDKTYYLGPRGEQYGQAYALLQRVPAESNKAGIATFVMRGREYLVALKAEGDLHTLHWADEIRDLTRKSPICRARRSRPRPRCRWPHQLIDALTTEGNPEDFHDTLQEKSRR